MVPDEAPVVATQNVLLTAQAAQTGRKYATWSDSEEGHLIAGVKLLGVGSWEAIRMEESFGLRHRTALQLKDKWRNLVKYKHVAAEDFPSCIADCRKRQMLEASGGLEYSQLAGNGSRRRKLEIEFQAHELSGQRQSPGLHDSDTSPIPSHIQIPSSVNVEDDIKSARTSVRHPRQGSSSNTAILALGNVRKAHDKVIIAHRIQVEANKLFSQALTKASNAESISRHHERTVEHIKSAQRIAEMASEKAREARDSLRKAIRQLQVFECDSTMNLMSSAGKSCERFDKAIHDVLSHFEALEREE